MLQEQNKSKRPGSDAARRKKSLMIYALMFIPFLGCMYLIFGGGGQTQPQGATGVNLTLPEGRGEGIVATRQKALELFRPQEKENGSVGTVDDPFGLAPSGRDMPGDPLGNSRRAYREATAQVQSFYSAPRRDPEVAKLERQVADLTARLAARDTAPRPDPVKMAETQYALAAKYLGIAPGTERQPRKTAAGGAVVTPVRGVGDDPVSMLAVPRSDTLTGMLGRERNIGFNTAVGRDGARAHEGIRVCVDEDQTLTSGDRIRLRLMEAIDVGGRILAAGEVIYGTASIAGQRMQVEVSAIEADGSILSVELTAHDMDGQRGLFIPDSKERTAAKEAAASVGSSFGSGISVTHSAGQQVAMDAIRGVMTGGSQYISSKLRQVKVTVKAGYQLLLISKK